MQVQKLRLKQGWSQQQLADASGLSIRTIQRIEKGMPASTETLKSIAAVFDVDFSTLQQEQAMTETLSPTAQQEAEAFQYVRKLRGFYLHLAQFVAIVALLTCINLVFSPGKLWVQWVFLGWGIGLLSHALRVFRPFKVFGPEWERKQVERRLGRPL